MTRMKEDADSKVAALRNEHDQQLKHLMQKEANLLDACKETVAKGDAEISRLNAQHSSLLESIRSDHVSEMEQLKASHRAEVDHLQKQHSSRLDSLRDDHVRQMEVLKSDDTAELARIQREHSLQMDMIKNEHTAELERLTSAHSVSVDQIRSEHLTEIDTLKSAHADELERLREERQVETEKHAAALVAEFQRRMDEQKAELDSMALSMISLQDDLQHARDEASTVAESVQNTLTCKHDSELAALKQQFENDCREMECRCADELAERDAMISDAEAVLLKKEEKVEELEEELRKVRQKLTVQLENVQRQHAEELLAVESAHVEQTSKLNEAHTQELERFKQEWDSENKHTEQIELLENVISQGHLMVNKLKSDIADYDERLKKTEHENSRLHENVTELHKILDSANEQVGSLDWDLAEADQQNEQLRSELQVANSRWKAAEEKLVDLEHQLATAGELTKSSHENLQTVETERQANEELKKKVEELESKVAEYKDESERFNIWADDIEADNKELHECFKEEKQRTEELEVQLKEKTEACCKLEVELKQSTDACVKLEAERKKLQQLQKPSDAELQRQLIEQKLKCNKLKNMLDRAQDEHDDKTEKLTQEITRLQEEKRDLQTTIRRQLNALNDTLPGQHAAAATAKQPAAARPLVTSCGVVEQWCISQYETEVTRLRRELDKKEKEIQHANEKIEECKTYIKHMKKREAVKTAQQLTPVNAAVEPAPVLPVAAAAAVTDEHLELDARESKDKISDCKPQ